MPPVSKYSPEKGEWEEKHIHPEVAESCLSVMTEDKRDMKTHVCRAIVRDLRSEHDEAHFVYSLGYPRNKPVYAMGAISISANQNVRIALDSEQAVQEFIKAVPDCVDLRRKNKAMR